MSPFDILNVSVNLLVNPALCRHLPLDEMARVKWSRNTEIRDQILINTAAMKQGVIMAPVLDLIEIIN